MHSPRHFFLKTFLFAVLIAGGCLVIREGVLRLLPPYLDPAARIIQVKRDWARSDRTPVKAADVLVLGDSRLACGFRPDVFEAITGLKSLNLALPASTIAPSVHLLREYLRHHPPPKWIILSIAGDLQPNPQRDYYRIVGVEGLDEAIGVAGEPAGVKTGQGFLFPSSYFRKETSKAFAELFNPAAREKTQSIYSDFVRRLSEAQGYFRMPKQNLGIALPDQLVDAPQYDPRQDAAIGEFFKLAAEHKIPVLIVEPPVRPGIYRNYSSMPQQYEALLSEFPGAVMAEEGWKLREYPAELFFDQVHLTHEGAAQFTRELAKDFREVASEPPRT